MKPDELLKLAARGSKLIKRVENTKVNDWFRVENADSDERAALFIYGHIGDYWEEDDTTAGAFAQALREITAPALDLHINSPGGIVFDGVAIYSALLNHPATVDVYVDGLAASAASFVAMAGENITIEKPAKMMIHDASGLAIGNADDMREFADLLDMLSQTIAEVYADRAGGTADEWRERMKVETWYSAAQAVEAGLADKVNNPEGAASSTPPSNAKTSAPEPVRRGQLAVAVATATEPQKGKSVEIDDIMAAMRTIIDEADGRPLSDEQVKSYEKLEADLATKRTERVLAAQASYEAPAKDSVSQAVAASVPARRGNGGGEDSLDKAFEAYLRSGQPNADIADLRVTNAQSTGTGSQGGYMVPEGFRQKLVDVRKAFGGLATAVEEFSTESGNPMTYPVLNDTANEGGITAESAAFEGGADLVFGEVELGAYKYTTSGADVGGNNTPLRVPVELLQDAAFDVTGLISRKFGERIARAQATDWVNGAGTTEPLGLFTTTTDVALATGNAITYAKLLELEGELDPAYEQGAQWVMSKAAWTQVRGVVDGDGRPLVIEASNAGMGGAPQRTLLGYPVIIDQAAGAVTGDDVVFAALGNFLEAYVIRRVSSLVVVVNPWSRANNGEVEFTAWERADGTIQNRAAYVTLATFDAA